MKQGKKSVCEIVTNCGRDTSMAENVKKNPAIDNDDWTPVWEGKPKKAGGYLVTRVNPKITTTAFLKMGNGGATRYMNACGRPI